MTTIDELKKAVDRMFALKKTGTLLKLNSDKREKIFEVYVLSLIAEAVKRAGGSYELRGIQTGPHPKPVVFRAGPGRIYSSAQNFAYLYCTINDRTFELHLDVEFEGTSGATHEMDISIIEGMHAEKSRVGQRNPKHAQFLAECKFYSSSTPSIGVARAMVGLMSDFRLKIGSAFVSNSATNNLKNYMSNKGRPDPFTDLDPSNMTSEERFIMSMEVKIRKWAAV